MWGCDDAMGFSGSKARRTRGRTPELETGTRSRAWVVYSCCVVMASRGPYAHREGRDSRGLSLFCFVLRLLRMLFRGVLGPGGGK